METYLIPLSALFVSCGTLIFAVIINRRKANGDYVETLDRRLVRVEQELADCIKDRAALERKERDMTVENLELRRRLNSA